MALVDDFKKRFGEFDSDLVDSKVPTLELEYKNYYNFPYGENSRRDSAILLLIAHLLTYESSSSPSRLVGSKGVGGISLSYVGGGDGSAAFTDYNTTRYGQLFLSNINGQYFSQTGAV